MCMILPGRYSWWGSWEAIRDNRKAFRSWSMCSCFEADLWRLSYSGKHEAGSPAVVGFSVLCSVPLADINAGMPWVGFTRDSRTCVLRSNRWPAGQCRRLQNLRIEKQQMTSRIVQSVSAQRHARLLKGSTHPEMPQGLRKQFSALQIKTSKNKIFQGTRGLLCYRLLYLHGVLFVHGG